MTSDEVPDDLVHLALQQTYPEGAPDFAKKIAADILAAVLPAHEATVRERVADEIANLDREGSYSSYDRGLNDAEAVARGAGR